MSAIKDPAFAKVDLDILHSKEEGSVQIRVEDLVIQFTPEQAIEVAEGLVLSALKVLY